MSRGVKSTLVVASIFAVGLGILSACADDAAPSPVPPPDNDSGFDGGSVTPDTGTDAPTLPKDAGDPDARGPYDPSDVEVVCDASPCATQIVAGESHFCARMSDSTVRCWGSTQGGAIGNLSPDAGIGSGGDAGTVRDVGGLSGVIELSAAFQSNCARVEDGGVKCWGANDSYQLGITSGRYNAHPVPNVVPLPAEATHVELGTRYACALLANGEQWCWGADQFLQQLRRDGAVEANPLRAFVPGQAKLGEFSFVELAMGDNTIIGVTAQGETFSWGAVGGDDGILAGRVGSISPDETPRKLPALMNAKGLVASSTLTTYPSKSRGHACAIVDGQIYCWGRSYASALGTGVPGQEIEPALAPFADTVKTWPQQLAAADEITCARMTDGSIYCAGSDLRGRLATGKPSSVSAFFTKIPTFTKRAVQVATSDGAVCALVEDGTVECWGSNAKGELGFRADDEDHPTPVKVAF